ncbi:hypothetical protein LCI18_006836 [Fusarium solani-melongenae]|uniref:Uncharacterized protein n=1 Tax=Fusarium solani subsp. cucurbitae TaxID=2747967 RepID=A0ACD3Z4Y5_FUSSC|nr:hypothetical protein LCI18_006836 [Fusarium solani-melongenae]
MSSKLSSNIPMPLKYTRVSFPSPEIMLVMINRPQKLNSLPAEGSYELDSLFRWYDNEATLLVAILSGVGHAFCVGADLKEWAANQKNGSPLDLPANGFGGISLRHGKKPIIAAVNGSAYGGGCEMVVNCDLVIASASATFALPEVKRGVVAMAGSLPRLMRTLGRQRATELTLTGRTVTAQEFRDWGICNLVVEQGASVVDEAIRVAKSIAENSPDAVIVTREGLKLGWEALGAGDASRVYLDGWVKRIYQGDNIQEGLTAFEEKRSPRWKSSRL